MRTLRIAALSAVTIAAVAFANPASATGTLDQQYTVTGGSGTLVEGANQAAQVFTAGLTGPLVQIDFRIRNFLSTGPDLTMMVKATTAGLPTGSALATSTLARSATSGSFAWVSFTFPSPITVVSGTQYAIILSTTAATTGTGYSTEVGSTSIYSGGDRLLSNDSGSTWGGTSPSTEDFRTYVSVASSSDGPAPAPVLQAFGMPASGTCDAAAPVVLNWGGAGSGGWGNSWAQWANGGNGGPVCTRTLVYSNSASRWIVE